MPLELDHVFVFVDAADAAPGGRVRTALDGLGLVPSYERRHTGQGTANLCYAFDDAYLELLFVVDAAERDDPAIARNGFAARSAWAASGASPFGVAVRGGPPPGETWPYRIAAFPPGLSIPVSTESDDPRLPFLFGSPGTTRPDAWSDGRAGARQTAAGFSTLAVEAVVLPADAPPSPCLDALAAAGVVGAVERRGDRPAMILRLGGRLRLRLPDAAVI
jgi:hypothetical protein